MVMPVNPTWEPGQPLPRRANKPTIALILSQEFGIPYPERAVEKLTVRMWKARGVCTYDVQECIKAEAARIGDPVIQSAA